jgi:16S rRNA G966 N2-methylase RsmD
MNRTPKQWAEYIKEALGGGVTAIIETGQRLAQAHEAYRREPQQWGRTWENWCKTEFGLSAPSVSQYETIAENLFDTVKAVRQKLPQSWGSLYSLAMLRQADAGFFDAAVADGRINPEITREQIKTLTSSQRRLARRAREREAADIETQLRSAGLDWRLHEGDFRNWTPHGKSTLILTDPPYDIKYLDLYNELPHRADDWLDDEGWLAVMTGQRHLPQIMAALSSGPLAYVWTFALASSSGRANGIQFIQAQNLWKPVILLRKGDQPLREWTADLISYDWEQTSRNVIAHRWQQEVSPLQKLIRAMTTEGDLVLDPCCGSGTTGVAALSTGRHFAGCDIEAASIESASERLQQQERLNSANASDQS